jgi:hypothetical protein
MTAPAPADDIPARLRDIANRAERGKIAGVVCLVVDAEEILEVHGFGPYVEHGAVVDQLLKEARQLILKREFRDPDARLHRDGMP